MDWKRWLIPKIDRRAWSVSVKSGLIGAGVLGAYGIVQDQVTFSISEEYFTLIKFDQFAWANPELPNPRWFAALIGLIAGGTGGLMGGWILARLAILWDSTLSVREIMNRFWLCPLVASVVAALAFVCGRLFGMEKRLGTWLSEIGVADPLAFSDAMMIHNGSYLGAVAAVVFLAISIKRTVAVRSRK